MQNGIAGKDDRKDLHREIVFSLDGGSADTPATGYRVGMICPKCRQAVLDYDGLLNVVCPHCGVVQGGCFT